MKFKSLFAIAFVALVSLFLTLSASAQVTGGVPLPIAAFSGTGTLQGTTNSYCVVSANSRLAAATGGQSTAPTPYVQYLNVTGDAAGSKVTFYTATNYVDAAATNYGTTTQTISYQTNSAGAILYGGSNSVSVAGTRIVIRHCANDTYELNTLASSSGVYGATLVLGSAPIYNVQAGDRLYIMTANGTIPVGAATVAIIGAPAIYNGVAGTPLCISINGTSTPAVNAVSAGYQ
jgi:hypothetical protein